MRFVKWAILVLLVISVTGVIMAQADSWSAYLYNSVTRQLLRVHLDGTQTPIDLNLPEGSYLGDAETALANNGDTLAYCLIDYTSGTTTTPAVLTVYDVPSGTTRYQQDLGASMGCWLEYSADGSMLVVSLVNYFGGDPAADITRPIWETRVLDADTGAQMASLTPFSRGAAELGLLNDFALMPDVRYFANNQIIFAALPWGTEAVPLEPAFLWDLNSGALQPFDDWWHVGMAVSGADVTWLDVDPALPWGNPGGPVPPSNVVRMRDAAGELINLYHSPDWVLLDAEFIDNGRRLALSLLQPFDPNSPNDAGEIRWIALDRAGNVTELAATTGFSQVMNAPDGYLYLSADSPNVGATMTLEYRAGDQARTLFTGASDDSGAAWNLIGAAPVAPAPNLPPFPPR